MEQSKIILLDLVSPYPAHTEEQDKNALPSEFRLLKYGTNRAFKIGEGHKEFEFSKQDASRLMANYIDAGKDIPIDWEHQMLNGEMGGYKPAAGWFKLGLKEDGIYATDINWMPKAQEALKSREYRYFSPAMHYDEDGKMDLMLPAALTNLPALKDINALMNSSITKSLIQKDKTMSDESKIEMLAATEALSAMKAEKAKMEAEITDMKVDMLLDKAVGEGKLTPAKKDELKKQVGVLGLSGLAIVLDHMEAKVARTPIQEPSHVKQEVKGTADELTLDEKKMAQMVGVSFEAFSAQKKITMARINVARGMTDVAASKTPILACSIDNTKSKALSNQPLGIGSFSAGRGSMNLKSGAINMAFSCKKPGEDKE
jgi:phage I-like protein